VHPLQEQERAIRDREAALYDEFFPRWRTRAEADAILREVRRRIPGRAGSVADLGTGTGRIARALAGLTDRVVGVDFSPESLRRAEARVPRDAGTAYEFVLGDATATGLPADSFDVVTCAQVLQHLPTSEARAALLDEIHRLLRPGGVAVLMCYGFNLLHRLRGEREHAREGLFVRRHSPRELRSALRGRFEEVRVRPRCGLPDWLPSPALDRFLSTLPGFGLLGRVLVGSGRKPSTSAGER
jgi:SAM-dependent methyltransferase